MLQFILSGLAIGAIYGLIGMGLAISFYVTRVINFAEGQLMMAAIMITAAIFAAGYSPWLAVFAGLLAACVIAVLSYLIAVKPILAFNRFSFGWLVSTLGFAVVVENAAAYIWGPTSRAFPQMLNGTPASNLPLSLAAASTSHQVARRCRVTLRSLRIFLLSGKMS